jgi:hypothetical protein
VLMSRSTAVLSLRIGMGRKLGRKRVPSIHYR